MYVTILWLALFLSGSIGRYSVTIPILKHTVGSTCGWFCLMSLLFDIIIVFVYTLLVVAPKPAKLKVQKEFCFRKTAENNHLE